ncbi:hypothetical protein ACROYT_G013278 [Oculina patagonica]
MSSHKGQGRELSKMKKPGNDSKDPGETSKPKMEKLQGKAAPGSQGTQTSKSSGACGTSADEVPSKRGSKDGDPTKQNTDLRGHYRGKPQGGTKSKQQATSSETGKANPDLRATMGPSKGGTQKTERAKSQSSDSQGATGPSGSRPISAGGDTTKQNTDRRGRYGGKPREATKSKLQATSTEKDRGAILEPKQGGTQKTVGAKSQSSDSQGATGPSDRRPNSKGEHFNKQKKQDPKGRGGGASQEGDRAKQLTSSTGKGKPSGKNQEHRPGKPNPTKRNATSATQKETQSPAGRTQKGDQKKSSPRKGFTLDLKTLKEKDCTEVVHMLNDGMARLKFLLRSEEEQHNSDDFIFDLTCTLAIVCDAPANENTNRILAALKGSAFFSSKIPCLLDRIQKAKTAISDPESQRRLIGWLIKIFSKYLMHLPSSYSDPPYDPLRETLDQSDIDGKDELKNQLDDFKQRRDDIIKAEREKKHGRRYTNKAGQKPPNDFRDMPICPTNKEIKSQERPFLRKNIKKGRYQDAEHYLDVQFRLLREDFLEPLREGIYEITHNIPRGQRNQLMKCYQGVRIIGKELTLSGIIYNVQFDVSKFPLTRWANTKRLSFGSFLCFSKDNFETMLFATVANRDPEDLQKGRFEIQFIEEQNIFDIEKRQQEYQMVESPAFFEAYRHVLKGLKELNEDSMPFTKYLVECSTEVDPPEYLRREDDEDPVCYHLSRALNVRNSSKMKTVPVLKPEAWPSADTLPLNGSQLEALRTAITSEFSVIQGPPGTGKTYVGGKIVRCLLENREQWDPENVSPMLMVCYTNHALDQFLEKVLEFLPKREIIRVGGRSKSEELVDCNLKVFTKHRGNYARSYRLGEMEKNQKEMESEMEYCKKGLAKADKVLLELRDLEAGMTSQHADQFYGAVFPRNATSSCQNPPNTFKLWLCNNKEMNDMNKRSSGALMESQKVEGRDGSILQEDDADEDDDDFLRHAAGAHFDVNTNSNDFQEESVENRPKENVTTDIATGPILKSNQGQSTNTKDKNQLNGYTSYLKETSMSDSMNVGRLHKDFPSRNQSAEQCNILEALQQSLDNDSQLQVAEEVEDSKAAKQFEEKSQLLNVKINSDPLSERPDTVEEESKEEVMKLHEADVETIAVEDEAAWIENQRFIEGEEEYTLVKSQKSDRGKSEEENDGDVVDDTEESQKVNYQQNVKPFVWKKEESGISEEKRKGGQSVEPENSQKE